MKIDIGPEGKILGHKRVTAQGTVGGLADYAGEDVLVILPGGQKPVLRKDAGDLLAEAETLVKARMDLAFREYRNLRKKYAGPEEAARAFLKTTERSMQDIVARADAWVREQRASLDKKTEGKRRANGAQAPARPEKKA